MTLAELAEKKTLDELREQKKQIEAQIREILDGDVKQCGRAKIDKEHYPTDKPDEYGIYVKRIIKGTDRKAGWYSIIRSTKKEEAVECIPEIIRDLQELYDKLHEEES